MTAPDLASILAPLPTGATVPVGWIRELLTVSITPTPVPESPPAGLTLTWRERLWLVPAETRLRVPEAAEALGRSPSWVYKRTGPGTHEERLPCRKLDGELVFVAGELRTWIRDQEHVEHALASTSTEAERRLYIGGKP